MNASALSLLALLLPAAGGIVAAVLGYRQVVKASQRQAQTAQERARDTPYGDMVTRVAQQDTRIDALTERAEKLSRAVARLERRVEQADDDLDTLTDALWAQHEWQKGGATPPAPTIGSEALRLIHDRRNGHRNVSTAPDLGG